MAANTTGIVNAAFGQQALFSNTTGGYNVAVGRTTLYTNTTGVNNIAIGFDTLYYNNGVQNVAIGGSTLGANTTGNGNTANGTGALFSNTTGNSNTANGMNALYSNTTSNSNTAVGYQAGYNITTGSKNTILGGYNGNQGGLDIRTASNNIVLSDGDGNPRFNYSYAGIYWGIPYLGKTGTSRGSNTIFSLNSGSNTYDGSIQITDAVANNVWWGLLNGAAYVMTNSGGVELASAATSWSSASDSRLKNVTGTYTNALIDIDQIEAVKFTWKSDKQSNPQVGVIAQSVQGVVPEAISTTIENGEEYLSVRYTELIPLMIASIQELKAEVDSLKSQLNGAST